MKLLRAVMIALVVALAAMVNPERGSAATTTISAEADAYVHAEKVGSNTGRYLSLRVRNQEKVNYVRFTVPTSTTLGGTVARATLRLHASTTSRCSLGVQVLRAAS